MLENPFSVINVVHCGTQVHFRKLLPFLFLKKSISGWLHCPLVHPATKCTLSATSTPKLQQPQGSDVSTFETTRTNKLINSTNPASVTHVPLMTFWWAPPSYSTHLGATIIQMRCWHELMRLSPKNLNNPVDNTGRSWYAEPICNFRTTLWNLSESLIRNKNPHSQMSFHCFTRSHLHGRETLDFRTGFCSFRGLKGRESWHLAATVAKVYPKVWKWIVRVESNKVSQHFFKRC